MILEVLDTKEETIPVDFWGAVSCLLIILFIYENREREIVVNQFEDTQLRSSGIF